MNTPRRKLPTLSFPEMMPDKRLGEMMLYVAKKSQGDPNFGATKLNKILFFSDFCSYGRTGKPITGSEYMKLPKGPVPRRLMAVKSELEADHAAAEQHVDFLGKQQNRIVALRDPDLSAFSASDIAIVDEVIDFLKNATAAEVSELSHGRAWRAAHERETIPYEATFISDREPDEKDVADAHQFIRQYGWSV